MVQLSCDQIPCLVRTVRVFGLDGRPLLVSSGSYCRRHCVSGSDGNVVRFPQDPELVALHHSGNTLFSVLMQVRNMCVFIAPIFAAATAIASYLLTYEATRRTNTSLLAAAFVGLVPSYISRSVGGSYDNEAVAIFALIFTFYLWVKSVNTGSLLVSACCALSYFYMVASWGGYVFIINIIPIYVVVMVIIRTLPLPFSRRPLLPPTLHRLLHLLHPRQHPRHADSLRRLQRCQAGRVHPLAWSLHRSAMSSSSRSLTHRLRAACIRLRPTSQALLSPSPHRHLLLRRRRRYSPGPHSGPRVALSSRSHVASRAGRVAR